jgi:PAS domain S-box-containing protein
MTREQLEWVFKTMPVDVTFVDKDDTVRYFSQTPDRIFKRSKAVIGRKVQKCHPPKSVDVVERILNDFKEGKRDKAEFWLNLGGRLIHIRYFAVRNGDREYLGCLEVSQDLTPLQKIEGEKRLLDD